MYTYHRLAQSQGEAFDPLTSSILIQEQRSSLCIYVQVFYLKIQSTLYQKIVGKKMCLRQTYTDFSHHHVSLFLKIILLYITS